VGHIDVSDGFGHEIIARYTTNLATNGTWYTDSNGREMQVRLAAVVVDASTCCTC
jgi:hypothetical protein